MMNDDEWWWMMMNDEDAIFMWLTIHSRVNIAHVSLSWRCSPCSSELCRFRFETCSFKGALQELVWVMTLGRLWVGPARRPNVDLRGQFSCLWKLLLLGITVWPNSRKDPGRHQFRDAVSWSGSACLRSPPSWLYTWSWLLLLQRQDLC